VYAWGLQVAYLLLEAGATTSASSDVSYGWQILHQKMEQDVPSLNHALVRLVLGATCSGLADVAWTARIIGAHWIDFYRRARSGRYGTQWSRMCSCRMRSARSRYCRSHAAVIWHISIGVTIVVTPMHRTFTQHVASNCLQYLSRSIKDAVRQKVEKDPRRLSS